MYERIVVGADSSETAGAAVAHAERLAQLTGAELHIVSAYRPTNVAGVPAEFRESVRADSGVQALLDDLVSRCAASGITVRAHQSRDDPAGAIVSVAAEVGADLVVVGNKGLKGLKRLVVGSVPSKVVHDAPCSTLVVHTS